MKNWIYAQEKLVALNDCGEPTSFMYADPWAAPFADLLNVSPELSRLLEAQASIEIAPPKRDTLKAD